jgi:hypothetical protein
MKQCLVIIEYFQNYYIIPVSHRVNKINNYKLEVMNDWENIFPL